MALHTFRFKGRQKTVDDVEYLTYRIGDKHMPIIELDKHIEAFSNMYSIEDKSKIMITDDGFLGNFYPVSKGLYLCYKVTNMTPENIMHIKNTYKEQVHEDILNEINEAEEEIDALKKEIRKCQQNIQHLKQTLERDEEVIHENYIG